MRNHLPHKSLLLLIYICIINAQIPTITQTLQTNQYILVSQQDAVIKIETDVKPGTCPQFMSMVRKNRNNVRYSGIHLIRDSFGRSAPLLMTIKDDEMYFNAHVFPLNVSNIFQLSSRKALSFLDKGSIRRSPKNMIKRKIKATLFDSASRMLYVDISSSENFELEQFYIDKLFSTEFQVTHIRRYFRPAPDSRYDWQEDPYVGKFYYKERIDDEVQLFEIPMAAFIPTVWDGEVGVKIGSIKVDGTLMGATGGLFYTVRTEREGNKTKLSTSLVPSNLGAGLKCEIKVENADVPKFNKLIVIRNHDYCMLRDDANYIKSNCDAEQNEYMSSVKLEEDGSTDIVKWLLVTCIILFMIIVLLFVYIYWLRSTFVSDYDRTHPNEFETEASLFVAKQRSFPSVYQDPALLDVSVDRWN